MSPGIAKCPLQGKFTLSREALLLDKSPEMFPKFSPCAGVLLVNY
jgi:hypothetical protein